MDGVFVWGVSQLVPLKVLFPARPTTKDDVAWSGWRRVVDSVLLIRILLITGMLCLAGSQYTLYGTLSPE